MTIHRRENLEDLQLILDETSKDKIGYRIHFYVHPHTKKYIVENKITIPHNISLYEPVDRKNMLLCLRQAKFVITDSGGLVKEAHWAGVPFTYIGENPWPETEVFGKGDAAEQIRGRIDDILGTRTN